MTDGNVIDWNLVSAHSSSTGSGGTQGPPGPPGEALANMDGGFPDSNYGGVTPLDCGGP